MMNIELVDTLKGHTGKVWNIKWNPQGTILASCGQDKSIRLWSKQGQQWKLKTLLQDTHQKTIREVSWSPCGQYLASASFDGLAAVWYNKSGQFECNSAIEGHENEVKSVSWSKSGKYLATSGRDRSVWIWEHEDVEIYEVAGMLSAHTHDVKKVIWHPHLDLLVSAGYDNTIKMFVEDEMDNEWTNISTLRSHESTVWSLAFDKEGSRLVSCSDDETLKIWQKYDKNNTEGVGTDGDYPTWKCVCTLAGYHQGPIYDVAWCHNSSLIATACADNHIRIFKEADDSDRNQPTFELISTKCAHDQDVNSVAWHPSEQGLIASASDDSSVKLWKLKE